MTKTQKLSLASHYKNEIRAGRKFQKLTAMKVFRVTSNPYTQQ